MSDHENETFETADAGSSLTYPSEAGQIRKGGMICIKDHPCKVLDVSTSKTGKHGHAKCKFVAVDIFTGQKMEDVVPSTHNCDVPFVKKTEYTLIDIDEEEGMVTLMDESNNTREDLKLPELQLMNATEDSRKLTQELKEKFEAGEDVTVTVTKAMGFELITSQKVNMTAPK